MCVVLFDEIRGPLIWKTESPVFPEHTPDRTGEDRPETDTKPKLRKVLLSRPDV